MFSIQLQRLSLFDIEIVSDCKVLTTLKVDTRSTMARVQPSAVLVETPRHKNLHINLKLD